MRFKKLKISVMVSLFLFTIVLVGIFSLSITQKEIVIGSSTPSQIGDILVVPIVKDEPIIPNATVVTTVVNNTPKKNTTNTTSSPSVVKTTTKVSSRKPTIQKTVTTRAS